MLTGFPVPGRLKAAARIGERIPGLGRALARIVKSLRQICNLLRMAALDAVVDRPRISPGRGDQLAETYILELHCTARSVAALFFSISVKSAATARAFPPMSVRACWWARSLAV